MALKENVVPVAKLDTILEPVPLSVALRKCRSKASVSVEEEETGIVVNVEAQNIMQEPAEQKRLTQKEVKMVDSQNLLFEEIPLSEE